GDPALVPAPHTRAYPRGGIRPRRGNLRRIGEQAAQVLLDRAHRGSPPRVVVPSGSAARSFARARDAVLFTVPTAQPSTRAVSASLRSPQKRSASTARC